jgi:quercetin dioxygenase-like cupin family protein
MAILHARPGELVDVRPLGAAIARTKSHTMIKTEMLEVIRIVMPSGKELPPHAVPGEITVQCLEGRVGFRIGQVPHSMTAGTMLYVEAGEQHSLRAEQDSSVLVTIVLGRKGTAAG